MSRISFYTILIGIDRSWNSTEAASLYSLTVVAVISIPLPGAVQCAACQYSVVAIRGLRRKRPARRSSVILHAYLLVEILQFTGARACRSPAFKTRAPRPPPARARGLSAFRAPRVPPTAATVRFLSFEMRSRAARSAADKSPTRVD